ncbi:MAG TPA: S8 family serine peptidase, partial [Rhodanobacteraceae bacterium]|nr:S8 family serine peptidase [Rhodanobacteraceae bacterium]
MMHALLTPNDTNFSSQWDLTDPTGGVNQTAAWDIATGTGIRVAVIDTGITPHSDLTGQTVGGYDFISDSAAARDGNARDSNPNDEGDWYGANECGAGIPASNSSWHGTHVTGTIAALTNNARGVASMAYGAKVVPVRVLGKCGGSVSDIVDAIFKRIRCRAAPINGIALGVRLALLLHPSGWFLVHMSHSKI